MSVRLRDYNPAAPPYQPGDRVRIRPAAEWHGSPDDGVRPVHCEYLEVDGPARRLDWTLTHDRFAGRECEVGSGSAPSSGLPLVQVTDPSGQILLIPMHPDWLAPVADPAGPPCVCPIADLMTAGCRCGRMAYEREARRQ